MPIRLSVAFEWPNEDFAFVAGLMEELETSALSAGHQTAAQQSSTTMHTIKLRVHPASVGGVLELLAGVAEAGALVTLDMLSEETG